MRGGGRLSEDFVGDALSFNPRAFVGTSVTLDVGWGTMPAIMQSSWKTAVISTTKGGRFAEDEEVVVRGRSRIRATLI